MRDQLIQNWWITPSSPCMTPKTQTWPGLSRSFWMTDGLQWAPPLWQGRISQKQRPHPWPTFFKLTGMMNSDAPTLTSGDPKTGTAVQQHWSGVMNLQPNSTGEIYFTPASFLCAVTTTWTPLWLFCSGPFLFLVPHCPLSKWTEPAMYSCDTYVINFWISSANVLGFVYDVVYWKLYLHMCLYVISLYRVLILYIFN